MGELNIDTFKNLGINENDMESIFKYIYENKIWGHNNIEQYSGSSGAGSSLDYNKDYISFLREFINTNNTTVVVDLGCGDFQFGIELYKDLGVLYYGYDVYEDLINYHNSVTKTNSNNILFFNKLDFYNDRINIPFGDLCIIKDVLEHWNYNQIYDFLDYLINSKKFKYILICNCSYQTDDSSDSPTGLFRPLNINNYPLNEFNLTKVFKYKSKEVYLHVNV
jgi:hypothetical protein